MHFGQIKLSMVDGFCMAGIYASSTLQTWPRTVVLFYDYVRKDGSTYTVGSTLTCTQSEAAALVCRGFAKYKTTRDAVLYAVNQDGQSSQISAGEVIDLAIRELTALVVVKVGEHMAQMLDKAAAQCDQNRISK
jgi:hypothetical protein